MIGWFCDLSSDSNDRWKNKKPISQRDDKINQKIGQTINWQYLLPITMIVVGLIGYSVRPYGFY